jgi:hypothetical protein
MHFRSSFPSGSPDRPSDPNPKEKLFPLVKNVPQAKTDISRPDPSNDPGREMYPTEYLIDDDIAEKTIELKRRVKIKLADAVIAATALVNNFKLVTRNVDDYKAVKELEIFNPFG